MGSNGVGVGTQAPVAQTTTTCRLLSPVFRAQEGGEADIPLPGASDILCLPHHQGSPRCHLQLKAAWWSPR